MTATLPLLQRWSRTPNAVLILAAVVAAGLWAVGVNPAAAQTTTLTAWRVDADPGMDATTGVWEDVPGVEVSLNSQTTTFPMGGDFFYELEPPTVTAKALHFDDTLYVAMRWRDGTVDLGSGAPEEFADAAAVQFPSTPESSVPAVCMGQADNSVNIWHWRADSQEGVAAVPDRGYVDRYASTDDLFYPARAAGNPFAATDAGAVQNLVAGGFGTLTPTDQQTVSGLGVRDGGGWSTVFRRSYESPGEHQPTFATGQRIDIAFAAWNGALEHRNGIKSVTSFMRLDIADESPPADTTLLTAVGVGLLILIGIGVFAAVLRPVTREGVR